MPNSGLNETIPKFDQTTARSTNNGCQISVLQIHHRIFHYPFSTIGVTLGYYPFSTIGVTLVPMLSTEAFSNHFI
ncbi:hypothetical protein A0J61_02632 [Choanephora cucurbitarum]|uniref:Uncharacterized protein n=1 Tax=Choanephora cucurbitarum TaxID=101091 RepID=A0A1C7NJZ8_9FUNG|nr:hypothetical protein A0J61_02632 [Choanephora cucurbitarum]